MSAHRCDLPTGWRAVYILDGKKITCPVCNTEWVRERYARYRVWTTVRADGKKERR